MLMAAGVSLQRVTRYLVDNPRMYFEAAATAGGIPAAAGGLQAEIGG